MAYKRGTDDIDIPKADAAIDIAHDGTFGAGGTLVFDNDKILVDSCITLAMQNDVLCRMYPITQQAGKAYFVCVNYSGGAVADDTVVKINYRISN